MYVHSYQSYIWNCVVSRRIREFGLVPRVGDLAFRGAVISDDDHTGIIFKYYFIYNQYHGTNIQIITDVEVSIESYFPGVGNILRG